MSDLIASIGIVWFLFGLVVVVLWALMSLAVFGIKSRLDRLHGETERTNQLLIQLINSVNDTNNTKPFP